MGLIRADAVRQIATVRQMGQIAAHVLTVLFWGRWQAKLSKDPLGAASPYLAKILCTHWIRTMLISAYGFILLLWAIERVTCQ